MVRYISLLLFIGLAWGQDVLVAVDGKEHKGKLLEQEEEYLFFLPDGAKQAQKLPIRLIKEIRLSNKEILDFGNDLVIFIPEVSGIQKNIKKNESENQNNKIPKLLHSNIKFLPPKFISSQIKKSMISYEYKFTGINPFLRYDGSALVIGYLGLRLGESIHESIYLEQDRDVGIIALSPSLIGVGYMVYLKKRHQRNFWEDERKSFIELTSNIDLSTKKRLESYNEQLSYTAADYHIDRYKPYLNFIPRVINSFLFTSSLVIFENIILGDYLGISNDILYLTTASNFIFVAPLIDKILQKRYYEKEKEGYTAGMDDNQKSIFSSRFDEKVKKSTINNANIAKANKKYLRSYYCSLGAIGLVLIYDAIRNAGFHPGQV